MVRMEALGTRWRTDVVEFLVASQDEAGELMVQESTAGRIVFIGTPGPRTTAALLQVKGGGRHANVVPIPDPGVPVRVLWKGVDGHVLESAPDWEGVPLPEVQEPTKPRKRSKAKAKAKPVETPVETPAETPQGGE